VSERTGDKTLLSDSEALPTQVDGDESYCAACGSSFPMDLDVCPKDGARLTKLKARPDALLGRVFDGRFEVRTALGQGGMGTVYRGWQLTVDREIAIKVIHPKLASDRVAVKRFLREARLSSRLNQPNIVNVYDFGQTEDGILYIAMELLRGHTLGRELESMRAMPLKRVLAIGQQLCDALDSAHSQGIVHRDLKPNNIVILDDPPGRDLIKVLDFGLAKSLVTDTSSLVTNTNAILGTPLYMPPEQIEGKPSDQRADLYSLGCILYQMLSGRPPFTSESVNLVLAAHLSEEPAPLPAKVPPALQQVVQRLMEKDPARRMRSAREAREVMTTISESGSSSSQHGAAVYDTTPDVRPRRLDTGPDALAETDHAIRPSNLRLTASSMGGGVAAVSASIPIAPRSRRWIAPVALAALLGTGAVVFVMKDRGVKPPVAAPIAAPAVDATEAHVMPDAAISIDASQVAATPDPPKPPPPKKSKKIRPPKAGSGSAPPAAGSSTDPSIDFIPSKK
jgi:serine/threonine-protein kinase